VGVDGHVEPAEARPETLKNPPTVRFTTNALLVNAAMCRVPLTLVEMTVPGAISADKAGLQESEWWRLHKGPNQESF